MIEPIGGNEMPKSFVQQIEDDENKLTLPWLKPRDSCELGLLGFRRYV